MSNKPRIAFCFSWQARTLDQTYIFFQKNLFDAAKEQWFDYDIFCAVEDDEDVDKVKLLNPTKVEKIKSSEVEKIISSKYKEFIEEKINKDYFWHQTSNDTVINALQQFYKIKKSIVLIWDTAYDIVIRLRFDSLYLRKFNFLNIKSVLQNNNTIICNKIDYLNRSSKIFFWSNSRYIEDFHFIGNSKSIAYLKNIFDDFKFAFEWFEMNFLKKIPHFIWLKNTGSKIPLLRKFWNFQYIILKFCTQRFIPESVIYLYLKKKNVNLILDHIPIIILKNDIEKSIISLGNSKQFSF